MQVTATEAKNRFGAICAHAKHEPVFVEKDGRIDTVRVPERGFVVVRIAFTDPRILGKFLFHCHVLKHEDKGMMANIEVYDPRRKTPPPNQDLFGFPICTTPPAQGLKLRASL